jgi:hypothetical protein
MEQAGSEIHRSREESVLGSPLLGPWIAASELSGLDVTRPAQTRWNS